MAGKRLNKFQYYLYITGRALKYFLIRYIWKFPYSDEQILNMPKEKYPSYLRKKYFVEVDEIINFKNLKHVGEQIQWLKLYDNTPIKTQLTDKILVRDWIKEQIGEEYLKPVYWVGDKFDDIPFDTLPDEFYIKTNHGCKWHMHIKDKNKLLAEKPLYVYVKKKFEKWLNSKFGLQNLELQYLNIEPKLFIEENVNKSSQNGNIDIEVWCFNGITKQINKIQYNQTTGNQHVGYDENFNVIKIKTYNDEKPQNLKVCDNLKIAKELSKQLSKNFNFVRIDWLLSDEKLYFNEMTFTPAAGFFTKDAELIRKEKIVL